MIKRAGNPKHPTFKILNRLRSGIYARWWPSILNIIKIAMFNISEVEAHFIKKAGNAKTIRYRPSCTYILY